MTLHRQQRLHGANTYCFLGQNRKREMTDEIFVQTSPEKKLCDMKQHNLCIKIW